MAGGHGTVAGAAAASAAAALYSEKSAAASWNSGFQSGGATRGRNWVANRKVEAMKKTKKKKLQLRKLAT